ncbi:MAG: nuclear transport factor 2 family protein [Paenibacillaceae bacterium]|nr:nuclear transport factor 2 family protein [Paenibacillaceae bacterium]
MSVNTDQQLAAKIVELEEKIQRLEDMEQIRQLKARYFRFTDEKKWSDFAALFTADAHIEADGAEYPGGGEGFANMIADLVGKAPSVHHGHMPEIHMIDKENAEAIWAMEDLLTFPDAVDAYPGHNGYGQYRETYRKVNGVWKISSMKLTRFRMDPLANWDPNTDPVTGEPMLSN